MLDLISCKAAQAKAGSVSEFVMFVWVVEDVLLSTTVVVYVWEFSYNNQEADVTSTAGLL